MSKIAIACTALLGVAVAQTNYCDPASCHTETPTRWYNCPTPTIPLSIAPSKAPSRSPTQRTTVAPTTPPLSPTLSPSAPSGSPISPSSSPSSPSASPSMSPTSPSASPSKSPSKSPTTTAPPTAEDLAPGEAEPTASPSKSPSTSPSVSPSAPSKSPTTNPTMVISPSPSAAPSAPSASPQAKTAGPTASPCQCATKRGTFMMPMPTYTCPGISTPRPVQAELPIDATTASLPSVAKVLGAPVVVLTNNAILLVFVVSSTPITFSPGGNLPTVSIIIVAIPVLTQTSQGVKAVVISAKIDLAALVSNVASYKLSYRILLADKLAINFAQISGLRFRRKGTSDVFGRKGSTLADSDVDIEFNICDTPNCVDPSASVAPVYPTAALNNADVTLARTRAYREITLLEINAALVVNQNIQSSISGFEIYTKVRGMAVLTPKTAATPAKALSVKLPIKAYWDEIASSPAVSKAAWKFAFSEQFTPKLNAEQIVNIVMLSSAGAVYDRRAGALAQTDGDVTQDIAQSMPVPPVHHDDDDDSSIIAVAVVVPIVGIAIIVILVWYFCCSDDQEEGQAKEQNAPYGDKDEPVGADQVDAPQAKDDGEA